MTNQNVGNTSEDTRLVIDLDELLNKIQLDHRIRSLLPDTYSDEDRERNLRNIDRISLMIEAFEAIRKDPNADNETIALKLIQQRTVNM